MTKTPGKGGNHLLLRYVLDACNSCEWAREVSLSAIRRSVLMEQLGNVVTMELKVPGLGGIDLGWGRRPCTQNKVEGIHFEEI